MLRVALERTLVFSSCIVVTIFVLWLRGASIMDENRDITTGLLAGMIGTGTMCIVDTLYDGIKKLRASSHRD